MTGARSNRLIYVAGHNGADRGGIEVDTPERDLDGVAVHHGRNLPWLGTGEPARDRGRVDA